MGYKYEGGGYRVWDPKRRVVVEPKDLVFFEDGLPPPTLNDSRPQLIDEDEPTTQPTLDHITEPTTLPAASDPPIVHGLNGGNARQWTNDDTSSAHHNMSTRALDEEASCRTQRRIR